MASAPCLTVCLCGLFGKVFQVGGPTSPDLPDRMDRIVDAKRLIHVPRRSITAELFLMQHVVASRQSHNRIRSTEQAVIALMSYGTCNVQNPLTLNVVIEVVSVDRYRYFARAFDDRIHSPQR